MTSHRIMMKYLLASLVVAGCPWQAVWAQDRLQEKLPEGARVVRLEVHPPAVTLSSPFDYAQLLVTAQLAGGERVDVTRSAVIQQWEPLLKVSPTGLARPAAEGVSALRLFVGDQAAVVPVRVAGLGKKYEPSFVRDVMPMMSKLGCNAGTCHGAQSGKNGFKLSLRGYDPLFDHRALTDDLEGRRFNRAAPETSLMLLKPSGGVPHVGGVLCQPGEPAYELFKAWIAGGVRFDPESPRVTGIDIFPKGPVVPLPGMKQQMAVLATYSDGSVRDVSAEAFIESSNTEVATVDRAGLVTAVRRGEAAMLARYEGAYTATTLVVMADRSGYEWKPVPEYNWIDSLVFEKLRGVKLLPSELCTDAEFVRRVSLDLTGLPPTLEEVRAFLSDPTPSRQKRDALVDRLIGSPEFVEHWTNKWADLLQVNRKFLGEQGAAALRKWIRDAVASNMPYDKFVYALLTGSGSTLENPPAAYYKVLREPGAVMENTTQLFLAIRFNCNKCHDHPFERWTQDQYYHLAAFFAQVGRAEDPKYKGQKIGGTAVEGAVPLVEDITDLTAGDVKHDRTGVVTPPQFPFDHKDLAPPDAPRRVRLAKWVTSKENPYFAKSYVNRIWSYLLGVGLIEPVDDIRAGNPPSNPKLLDRLTQEFVASGFNVREVMRTICKSRTYQQSIKTNKWNADDEINYSHAVARRLPAEVLYDAIHRATGSVAKLPGLPPGSRAAQLLDSNVEIPSGFLDLFGKPPRESACECERSSGMMLGPVLNLINGPIVGEAVRDPQNRIAKLVSEEKDDRKVVEQLFLAILNRPPTPGELETGVRSLTGAADEFARLQAEYAKLTDALAAYEKDLPAKQAEWEKKYANVAPWTVLEVVKATAKAGTLNRQPDGSVLAGGKNQGPELYTVVTRTKLGGITAVRLEVLTDGRLPSQGPGRAPNGNFVLNEFKVTASPLPPAFAYHGARIELPLPATAMRPVELHKAQADFAQDGFAIAQVLDNNPGTGWAVVPQTGKPHVAVFELKEPLAFPNGATLTFTLDQQYPGKDHQVGKFRLSATTAKGQIELIGPPDAVAAILATPADKRTDAQKAELAKYYRSLDPELARLAKAVADHPKPPPDARHVGAQDLAWALINSPEFLFNH
jgi:hypothetical protein